jgi:hypothetical protein
VAEESTIDYGQQSTTRMDIAKMYLDIDKHLMTFCSGGIVLGPTVTHALFSPEVAYGLLLASSLFCFAFALSLAIFGLYAIPREIEESERASEDPQFLEFLREREKDLKESGESRPPGWQAELAEEESAKIFVRHRKGWRRNVALELGYTFVAVQLFLIFLALNFASGDTWH